VLADVLCGPFEVPPEHAKMVTSVAVEPNGLKVLLRVRATNPSGEEGASEVRTK
jgi:hypothetical protein